MRIALYLSFFLAASAQAWDGPCKHADERAVALDLDGVQRLVVDIGANQLAISSKAKADNTLRGRGCASKRALLDGLHIEQDTWWRR